MGRLPPSNDTYATLVRNARERTDSLERCKRDDEEISSVGTILGRPQPKPNELVDNPTLMVCGVCQPPFRLDGVARRSV